ncbi:hypothetical protein KDK_24210 [Dictyobacter kobayashii]|uniref:Uncharacterized protein n=1 Tax=Dictyobacter kobayashii TaxID=2014872 RepID=A0A402AHM1_9CHLR|nr:hypothetical protein KDK_24210 [Dictyobacter kobayashii]
MTLDNPGGIVPVHKEVRMIIIINPDNQSYETACGDAPLDQETLKPGQVI